MRELLDVAAAVLPGEDLRGATFAQGGSHDVVLLPGVAVVRIARKPSAVEALPRRVELLQRLQDFPFAVPRPLTDVMQVGDYTAVALSWLPGRPLPRGAAVEPAELSGLLDALREVDCSGLPLSEPHAYAGGTRWAEVLQLDVIPRLPADWRDEARRRVDAALALPDVRPSLVHGDLAGENMHWADGRLIGVLDWDLAQPSDPAVDAACLAWYGWDTLVAAVDETTMHRARTWYGTFGLEQIAFAVLNGESEEAIAKRCETITAWLGRSAKILSSSG
ncbi:phosphotransferase [Kutzneria buriramensis]|uniref:Aminoglycoside phosphotransferase (APT) family kinase protein n=1 Tax=Kutzneria buriramensis TaxID=1045776 RepID=A0A3E0HKQ7_9PSEU|nr:phosphotransferase [Kutzneria buriramensis]REH47064.1 aminoglycoside phosphotransferase (APT) family kinase protein [Kutzneria buriramensis]